MAKGINNTLCVKGPERERDKMPEPGLNVSAEALQGGEEHGLGTVSIPSLCAGPGGTPYLHSGGGAKGHPHEGGHSGGC